MQSGTKYPHVWTAHINLLARHLEYALQALQVLIQRWISDLLGVLIRLNQLIR